jgi:probable F420-dependent oxidoreductase
VEVEVKYGIIYANWAAPDRDAAIELAKTVEGLGFESMWTTEHVVVPSGYESTYPYSKSGRMHQGEDFPSPDPLVWLSFIAAVTEHIRLATGILVVPLRNPLVLAKQVATLDVLSNGRVTLGVGAGWLEEEFRALGAAFEDRGDRTDEALRLMRTVWTEEVPSFSGRFHSFENVYVRPMPIQRPIPIVVGGHSKRAARRAGELGDGFIPAAADYAVLPGLIALAREHAERSGRDPAALEITMGTQPTAEWVEKLAAVGVDRILIPAGFGMETLEAFAAEFIATDR